ncbi:HugZ family protein [Thalassospira sp. TSL5-1]|uniref:HugZ family pyridoxamine 5'-phosphate oxidase n=1 Tax=Thalassospira sp. TSL5-1 TaxID=1544451 RepID=UPI00093AF778|nr:pyridoxamine 5'-phosphate oxidase family protein [Thalassospira sp. TSL5-1]OKH86543.1 hypothetical protein LF95_21440 [Thalassospira sp. TSL5-1]
MEQDPITPANDAASLRRLMRTAPEATLATLAFTHSQVANGWPVASMVQPVIDMDGAPIILISQLADHTRHIHNDPRVSLMFRPYSPGGTVETSHPAAAPKTPVTDTQRLTIFGQATKIDDARIERRYLTVQPAAALYAGFADFAFYRIEIEAAYWVGGFGKQRRLRGEQLYGADLNTLTKGHAALIDDVNKNKPDLIAQIAHWYLPAITAPKTRWTLAAIDCDGAYFSFNDTVFRLEFPHTICSMEDAQKILVKIGQKKTEIPI